jgi:hypothetical protein
MQRVYGVLLGFILLAASVASADITTGLQACYPMDTGSGSTAVDVTGNGHTGTITGAGWVTGALVCNGSSTYVDIPNSSSLAPGTGNFTITARVTNADLAGAEEWVYQDYSTSGDGLVLLRVNTSNKLECYIRDVANHSADAVSTTTLSTNTEYHVACVRNGTTVTLYLNGVADGTQTTAALSDVAVSDGPDPTICSFHGGGFDMWHGNIGSLKIFNRALSVSDINEDKNSTSPCGATYRIIVQ